MFSHCSHSRSLSRSLRVSMPFIGEAAVLSFPLQPSQFDCCCIMLTYALARTMPKFSYTCTHTYRRVLEIHTHICSVSDINKYEFQDSTFVCDFVRACMHVCVSCVGQCPAGSHTNKYIYFKVIDLLSNFNSPKFKYPYL